MILKKIFSPIVLINFLAMILFLVLVFIGVWYGTKKYTHHGEIIKIPDVTRIHHTDAALLLEQEGLIAIVADSGHNRNLAIGSVLMQQPKAGAEVKSGRKIYLTINSTTGPTLTLPDIADNCDVYEAEVRLRAMGFKLGPKEYVEGDKDWVINIKCRGRIVNAGEKIPMEAPLILVVGNSLTEDEKWIGDSLNTESSDEAEYEYEF